MKKMKLSEFFLINNPSYAFLKITPDTSIRNYNSSTLIKMIASMHRTLSSRIKYEERKFVIQSQIKCSYVIDIYKDKVDFIFIVPCQYINIAKTKIKDIWPKVTITQIDKISDFNQKTLKYKLLYKYEDALSLDVDSRNNNPLNNILNVIDILESEDRVTIFYNFKPTSQYTWNSTYEESINRFKENLPITRKKANLAYVIRTGAILLVDLINVLREAISEVFSNDKPKENSLGILETAVNIINIDKKLTDATLKKKNSIVIDNQIIIVSSSPDTLRLENNALSVCQAYKSIEADNELIYEKLNTRHTFNVTDFNWNTGSNTMSIEECSNFIQLPGRDLLSEFKTIKKVDTLESQVPEELRTGNTSIGISTYKGHRTKAYLSTDPNIQFLTLTIVGPTRAGKTTLLSNISNDSINSSETTIIFDFCGNCDLSEDISSVIPEDKILNIDCSNFEFLQGLGYNEIAPLNDNPFEIYRCAKTKTIQLLTLINSVNSEEEFKARMERFLEASATIVFISDGSIKDVFLVLQDASFREKYINKIPESQRENLKEYILTLNELDDIDKKGNKSTKLSYVSSILNRVQKLKQNTYMELMLKKDTKNNINLINEIQKEQLICIKMPEIMFATEQEKDTYCTYWLTKIWSSLQVRKWTYPENKRVKVNIIIDELYQVPNCQNFLKSKLSQIAKFGSKIIISCHYLKQIDNIRNELKAANSSYIMIAGCDKDNFNELKAELAPYTLEDLLNLKRYHSLNLIKYEEGFSKFICELPKPLK